MSDAHRYACGTGQSRMKNGDGVQRGAVLKTAKEDGVKGDDRVKGGDG